MRNPADFAWRIIAITPLPARVVSTAKLVSYLLRSGRYFRSLWKLYEPRGAGPRPAKAPSARNWQVGDLPHGAPKFLNGHFSNRWGKLREPSWDGNLYEQAKAYSTRVEYALACSYVSS